MGRHLTIVIEIGDILAFGFLPSTVAGMGMPLLGFHTIAYMGIAGSKVLAHQGRRIAGIVINNNDLIGASHRRLFANGLQQRGQQLSAVIGANDNRNQR